MDQVTEQAEAAGNAARLAEAMKRNASFASQEVQAALLELAADIDAVKAALELK
jgi:hypothetical protein